VGLHAISRKTYFGQECKTLAQGLRLGLPYAGPQRSMSQSLSPGIFEPAGSCWWSNFNRRHNDFCECEQ
jgi:hypothetical protein